MPLLDITNFSTYAIKTTTGNIQMVSYVDTSEVVYRGGYLGDSATKYDIDGTAAADVRLGQVRCRFKIVADTRGVNWANVEIAKFEGMHGKRGKLTGKAYGLTNTNTYTCTARCVLVQMEDYSVHQNPPLVAKQRQQAFINVRWELFSNWNVTSV